MQSDQKRSLNWQRVIRKIKHIFFLKHIESTKHPATTA